MSLFDMVIVALNLTVSLISAGWALLVLVDSEFRERAAGRISHRFFPMLYAARAVPIGIAAGIAPMVAKGPGVAGLLLLAAAVQFLDVGVAFVEHRQSMMFGAAFAVVVHAACMRVVL